MKYNYYLLLTAFLFLSILLGCDAEMSQESNTKLKINVNPHEEEQISINEWFSKIELIPLETSGNSLVKVCSKMIKYNHRYYIFDQDQDAIFIFDSIGKSLFSTLPLKGKGPNEYASMTDFNIDRYTGNMEFLDPYSACINVHDKDGAYLNKVNLPKTLVPLLRFKKLVEGVYLFYAKKQKETIQVYDLQKREIIKSMCKIPKNAMNLSEVDQYHAFYDIDQQVYFTHTFANNDIYCIDTVDYKIMKVTEYDFGKYNFTLDILPEGRDGRFYSRFLLDNNSRFVWVFNKCENDSLHMAFIYFKNKAMIVKYNKQTFRHQLIEYKFDEGCVLLAPSFIDNEWLYRVAEPADVPLLVNNKLLDMKSKQILQSIKEEDNPIIVKYKIKY